MESNSSVRIFFKKEWYSTCHGLQNQISILIVGHRQIIDAASIIIEITKAQIINIISEASQPRKLNNLLYFTFGAFAIKLIA